MAKNRKDRTSTAGDVVERLSSFLATTAMRPELDAAPIVFKGLTPVESPGPASEPMRAIEVGSGMQRMAETGTNASGNSSLASLPLAISSKSPVLFWVIAGICVIVAAMIGYTLM